ncbi:PREDICTED: uncharacterized protein LOC108362060 [Rhagoletis zephyria]|uniref:uncharacterized protein LOC108362060 n=1 Tax=Rhagoletis zephyria TaxID=28612 RepID=UPI00081139DE|nr:PREDICTED: uncharacterized protein LOC108362060 [Rhagoletis zephyria]
MAAEMQMHGYNVNSSSVKINIDNLTAKYRRAKTAMGTTGGSPASWPLHQIIGGFSINNVEVLIEESFEVSESPTHLSSLPPSLTQISPSPLPSTSSSASDKSRRKKQMDRLVTVCESLQTNFSEAMDKFPKSNEELVELEKAKLMAMQELQKDAKRLTDGVLDFLNRF